MSESPLNIMEYQDWIETEKDMGMDLHYSFITHADEEFLKACIYPMFYSENENDQFKNIFPYPLVLKDYRSSSYKPIYVIDNEYFTIIFFIFEDPLELRNGWDLSVHIKDHSFCDKRINEFKSWYAKYYGDAFSRESDYPGEFLYPRLDVHDEKVQDFCIEFLGRTKNCKLFRLLDILRLF